MSKMTGEYLGNLRNKVVDSETKKEIFTDGPKHLGGFEENPSPTDYFAMTLATCMMSLMAIQSKALNLELKGVTYEIHKEWATPPTAIKKISVHFFMQNVKTDAKQRERLEKAAKNCPVHHSLSPNVEQDVFFHWE